MRKTVKNVNQGSWYPSLVANRGIPEYSDRPRALFLIAH
jgi:hypothetical protein